MKLAQKFILDNNWKSETIIRFKFYLNVKLRLYGVKRLLFDSNWIVWIDLK